MLIRGGCTSLNLETLGFFSLISGKSYNDVYDSFDVDKTAVKRYKNGLDYTVDS